MSEAAIDSILRGARATWRAAAERDEALVRVASERRLREAGAPVEAPALGAFSFYRSHLVLIATAAAIVMVGGAWGARLRLPESVAIARDPSTLAAKTRPSPASTSAPLASIVASDAPISPATSDARVSSATATAAPKSAPVTSANVRERDRARDGAPSARRERDPLVEAQAAPLPPLPAPAFRAPPPPFAFPSAASHPRAAVPRRPMPPPTGAPSAARAAPSNPWTAKAPSAASAPVAPTAAVPPRAWSEDSVASAMMAAAMTEIERGRLDAGRERLRAIIDAGSPASVYEASALLAGTYTDASEQLAVWDRALPRLTGSSTYHARAERARLRLLARLGRRPPQPTTAE